MASQAWFRKFTVRFRPIKNEIVSSMYNNYSFCVMVILRCAYSCKTGHCCCCFVFFFYRATVIENSQPVEKNLPLSILMSSLPPTGSDAREQAKERLSTGTKFALRQWLQLLYSPPPGSFPRGDSHDTVFQGITKAGHQPLKSPFWGK